MSVVQFSTEVFPELGTRHVIASFTDENDVAVIPENVTWTLTDEGGAVINSRTAISATPDSSGSITATLTGNDLEILDGETSRPRASRVLSIYYEYDSTYGNNLSERTVYKFEVENLVGVS